MTKDNEVQKNPIGKPSEREAKALLLELLRSEGRRVEVLKGNDPPDWLFIVDNMRWAVEVTELHQYVKTAHKEEDELAGIEARLRKFGRKLEEETREFRKCGYILFFVGPMDKEEESLISGQVMDYILSSRNDAQILGRGEGSRIKTTGETNSDFSPWIGLKGNARLAGGNPAADIATTIDGSIRRILGSKKKKLAELSEDYDRRVLFIVNRYWFGDRELVAEVTQRLLQPQGSIDEVFYAFEGRADRIYCGDG
ncbi:MAG: hypothetical protein V1800_06950 [Candidatus Latescibacterota bacterium]